MNEDPFYRTHLEEEQEAKRKKEKRHVFSVSCNEEEYKRLIRLKKLFDTNSSGQALKESAWVGDKVLHTMFGEQFLAYLFKKERVRFDARDPKNEKL